MTPIIPSQPNLDTETCPTCGVRRDDIMADLCSHWEVLRASAKNPAQDHVRGVPEKVVEAAPPDVVDVSVIEDLESRLTDVSSDPCSGWSLRTPSNRLRVCERPAVWSVVIEYACGSDCVMHHLRRREEFCEKHMQSARDGSLWCTGCKATVTVVDAVRLGGESR